MSKEIQLLKNNDHRDIDDLEWLREFYQFLQGELPEGIHMRLRPKLSHRQAFSVIWYLQEHFSVFPDTIEKCWSCRQLFNSASEGLYWESKGRHYCGSCNGQVPFNYDRGKR